MIQIKVHTDEAGLRDGGGLDDLRHEDLVGKGLVWIDVTDPLPAEMERLGQEFGLHPLAIEDAVRRHQRPKIDLYPDFLFLVFYALESSDGRIQTRELSLFAGRHWLITVHEGNLPAVAETARRWSDHAFENGAPRCGLLVYAVLDSIVDGYFPVVDGLSERAEDLEAAIFAGADAGSQAEIFALKKDLLAIRRVIAPERDVMNVLVRRDIPLFAPDEITYFQDVYDHLLRIMDSLDLYREVLSSALEATLAMSSFRLNDTVKRMTSGSIILMSMTLVAGTYGMNFAYMPELDWTFGYPMALGLMATVGGGIAWFFHRIDWL